MPPAKRNADTQKVTSGATMRPGLISRCPKVAAKKSTVSFGPNCILAIAQGAMDSDSYSGCSAINALEANGPSGALGAHSTARCIFNFANSPQYGRELNTSRSRTRGAPNGYSC